MKQRLMAAASVLVFLVSATGGVVPASAQPDVTPEVTQQGQPQYGAPGAKNQRITSPEQLAQLRSADKLAALTPEQRKSKALEKRYIYRADGAKYGGEALAAASMDVVTFDECKAKYFSGYREEYWHKNRYSLCRVESLSVVYYQPLGNRVGQTNFTIVMIGNSRPGQRGIDFKVHMIYEGFSGTTFPNEVFLSFSAYCYFTEPDRRSTCTQGAVRKTVAQWMTPGVNEGTVALDTTTTGVPATDKYRSENRGQFEYGPEYVVDGPYGGNRLDLPPNFFRCDEATYVFGSKCVFDHVTSNLHLDNSDNEINQSTQLIRDAQTDINGKTYPGNSPRNAPGTVTNGPLYRLFKDYDTNNKIVGSRKKVGRACKRYTTRAQYPISGKQCDEYPYATTYQNSSFWPTGQGPWAVRVIDATHNGKAGNKYGAWLGDDHILDGDPFFVTIVN
ncbi:NucA/NucB deoxyribonuclease domain-containing protein [Lentzea cavernae]|uniref:Deoxyribonuclease NucA/NucB domain-containing protein n=1 Tax=Lentzea cavernae TaxID=2020703 RepID=A0ABQ3M388_9PSEU|nr:hypothetical protein [Lentzea cavernae]GHH32518.1 hypothetical protein GCM10017774_13550 [Lentzea cavernae]